MNIYKLRIAVLLSLRNSFGIFLITMLIVPVVSAIHRVSDGTWDVNWRLMLSVSGILTSLFFAFWLVVQLLESVMEEARVRRGRLVFPAAMWLRGLYLVGIVLGITIIVGMYREGDRGWILAVPTFMVLIGVFAWPRAIAISNGEVRQRRILFGIKRVPFEGIESVVSDSFRRQAVVFSKNGINIVHTEMHVQQDEFIRQLKLLAHKRVNSVGDVTLD